MESLPPQNKPGTGIDLDASKVPVNKINSILDTEPDNADAKSARNSSLEKLPKMSVELILNESKGYELSESIESLSFEDGMSAELLVYGEGKYYGSIKHDGQNNKLMHGIGRFVFNDGYYDGEVFEGQFKDNRTHGYYIDII